MTRIGVRVAPKRSHGLVIFFNVSFPVVSISRFLKHMPRGLDVGFGGGGGVHDTNRWYLRGGFERFMCVSSMNSADHSVLFYHVCDVRYDPT